MNTFKGFASPNGLSTTHRRSGACTKEALASNVLSKGLKVHRGPGFRTATDRAISSSLSFSALASRSSAATRSRTLIMRASAIPSVVLTREEGKNGKLMKMLKDKGVTSMELPLIEHADAEDRPRLGEVIKTQTFEWIVLTSPEAARVFLEGWREGGMPKVRIAVVGAGTAKTLEAAPEAATRPDVLPAFGASVATAVYFSAELPLEGEQRVLYPASAKAATTLQDGLAARGFKVTRLNTYDTRPAASVDPVALEAAKKADVITFASPSAIKAWMKIAGHQPASMNVACIGETSATAAKKLGMERIFYSDKPGLETFVDSIVEALEAKKKVTAA